MLYYYDKYAKIYKLSNTTQNKYNFKFYISIQFIFLYEQISI